MAPELATKVRVITPVDGVDVIALRRELLDATLNHPLTVLDLMDLRTLTPALVSALRSAAQRLEGRERRMVVANARPRVAAVLRTQCPLVEVVAAEDGLRAAVPQNENVF
jgi:hypothetical protein